MFVRVLLNLSTTEILGLFAIFASKVNKGYLQPWLIKDSLNSSKCLLSVDVFEQMFFNRKDLFTKEMAQYKEC